MSQQLREALRIAVDHIEMEALRISHCKDAALIDAALSSAGAEQEGWVMVPKEPTAEMVSAGQHAATGWEAPLYGYEVRSIYAAMLAPAPTSEPTPQEKAGA